VLPWAGGALLIVGVLVAVAVCFDDTAPPKETFSNEPVDVVKPDKNVAVPAGVKQIAQTFIKTARRPTDVR